MADMLLVGADAPLLAVVDRSSRVRSVTRPELYVRRGDPLASIDTTVGRLIVRSPVDGWITTVNRRVLMHVGAIFESLDHDGWIVGLIPELPEPGLAWGPAAERAVNRAVARVLAGSESVLSSCSPATIGCVVAPRDVDADIAGAASARPPDESTHECATDLVARMRQAFTTRRDVAAEWATRGVVVNIRLNLADVEVSLLPEDDTVRVIVGRRPDSPGIALEIDADAAWEHFCCMGAQEGVELLRRATTLGRPADVEALIEMFAELLPLPPMLHTGQLALPLQ
jgi:hypothetical protein